MQYLLNIKSHIIQNIWTFLIIVSKNLLIKKLVNKFDLNIINPNNSKNKSHNLILVIINELSKMIYYKPVWLIINLLSWAKIIFKYNILILQISKFDYN